MANLACDLEHQISQSRKIKQLQAENNRLRSEVFKWQSKFFRAREAYSRHVDPGRLHSALKEGRLLEFLDEEIELVLTRNKESLT